MESKVIGLTILGIVLGGVIGYFGTNALIAPKITEYEHQIITQDAQLASLSEELGNVQTEYDQSLDLANELESNLTRIQVQYEFLSNEHDQLTEEFNSISNYKDVLENNYDDALDDWEDVSLDVMSLRILLGEYTSLEDSFHRVLSESEVDKLSSVVSEITKKDDIWDSINDIYYYVNNHVEYKADIEYPYIDSYNYVFIEDTKYVTGFSVAESKEQIQTPYYTLNNKQGDCEDHAILIYAMMKYYQRNIHGTDYRDYLMKVTFSNGGAHLAVLIPVEGGNVSILDSAGNYCTRRYGRVTQKTASLELNAYANRWSDEGGISNIILYDVDVTDGDYEIDADGSVEQIIEFLES